MDFFLDSCVIIGHCDKNDPHYHDCQKFFKKYPLTNFRHFTSIILDRNLKTWEKRKTSEGIEDDVIDMILLCIKRLLQQITKKEYHGPIGREMYRYLVDSFTPIVGLNETDAYFVVDAICWNIFDCVSTSTFVSSDYKDIIKNRDRIIEEAKLYLPSHENKITLQIKSIKDCNT